MKAPWHSCFTVAAEEGGHSQAKAHSQYGKSFALNNHMHNSGSVFYYQFPHLQLHFEAEVSKEETVIYL